MAVWKHLNIAFNRGYLNYSTKDITQLKRGNSKQGRSVPALANYLAVKKNEFLMNNHNKQEFLIMLRNQISDPGIRVYHANTDADSSTVANALTLTKDYSVTVRRHSCMLVKKLYAFYWVLKKEKNTE